MKLVDNGSKDSARNTGMLVRVGFGVGGQASLDITDEGPGIPSEHQPYVFDRFYRVDQARTREWGGAGLGLAITRWAVEAHGGEIDLTSKLGTGTPFHVSLPLARDSVRDTAVTH